MRNEDRYTARYEQCLDEIIEQAMGDSVYEEIMENYDSNSAITVLESTYPEIMEKWGF